MTRSLSFTFAAALTLFVALIVGYALLGSPTPGQPAAVLSPASIPRETASAAEQIVAPLPSDRDGQAVREKPACITRVEPVAAQPPPAATQATAESSTPIQSDSQPQRALTVAAPLPRVSVPLAFRPLPPAVAVANPQVADGLADLQQNFAGAVAGSNQGPSQTQGQDPAQGSSPDASPGTSLNPNDPAYYSRWVAAQRKSDNQYRLLVGSQAFLMEQMKVNNQ